MNMTMTMSNAVGGQGRRGFGGCCCGGCDCGQPQRDRNPFGVCLCDRPRPYYGGLCARCGMRLIPTVIL